MCACVCARVIELATLFYSRGAKVSVTKYRFLQQLLALELRELTPDHLHRSLENPSEPLSASIVWEYGLQRQLEASLGGSIQPMSFIESMVK